MITAPVVVGITLLWAACLTPFVVAILYVLDVVPGHCKVIKCAANPAVQGGEDVKR